MDLIGAAVIGAVTLGVYLEYRTSRRLIDEIGELRGDVAVMAVDVDGMKKELTSVIDLVAGEPPETPPSLDIPIDYSLTEKAVAASDGEPSK